MSAVTAGAGGALVAVIGNRKLRIVAVLWVVGGLLVHHQIADWEHLGAFTVGLGLGYLLGAPRERRLLLRRPVRLAGAGVALVVGSAAGALATGAAVPAPTLFVPLVTRSVLPSGMRRARPGAAGSTTTSPAVPESAPTVVGVSYPSPALGGNRSAFIVLPPGYNQGRRRYPVVELLHGYPGAPGDIISGLDPVAAEELPGMPPFVGVAPDGRGPVYADSWFADTSRQKVGTAVSTDLMEFVTHHFRTNGRWSVVGLSAGGYGAAYLGESRPGRYRSVCALSGVFVADTGAFADETRAGRLLASPMSHTNATGPRTLLIVGAVRRHEPERDQRVRLADGPLRAGAPSPRPVGWSRVELVAHRAADVPPLRARIPGARQHGRSGQVSRAERRHRTPRRSGFVPMLPGPRSDPPGPLRRDGLSGGIEPRGAPGSCRCFPARAATRRGRSGETG